MASADRLIEVFNEAKARAVGTERDRFLSEACQGDPELKEQVLRLLQAHEGAGDFLKHTQFIPPVSPPTEKPGDKIGRYKLLQKIGEGGCGVVYMAEQEEPVRRRVAFKVIKLGMDTKQVVARFEAEGQALAMMDHPNIAKVFDAGATNTGRPYFVMELVRGIRITDYCDQNNLPTEERLKLFTQVCHAIQHAHQKGIIHRDIKPSNILVTINDGLPVPKVIDFGIAKAIEQRLTDKTVFTAFEQFIGTPAYMSPEQAEMTSLDIDTRADVYSLGVLLYELLSGNTPFDAEKLVASGVAEIRRIIREQEPPKPSTRLNTLCDADQGTVASHRHTDPPKLIHLLRGDLDWIVMKCLEKDRTRRYETASGLARDLQRHLDNEPVLARSPSTAYRTLKFIRRHRVGAATAGVVTLVLIAGLVASLAGFAQARRERDRAQAAQAETLQQKLRADQSAAESHRRLVLQYLANGNRSVDAGDSLSALPWFGRALEEDQADPLRAEMHRLRLATIIQQSPKLVALCFHDKTVNSVEFSGDGSRFVTASQDGTARVWSAVTGEPVTPILQHAGIVGVARFGPDGRWVATACQDGSAQIWNATTGEPRVPPLRHTKAVRNVAFSPDGLWVLTASEDATAQVWEAATGQRRGPPLQHVRAVRSAEFSPDGKRILTFEVGAPRLWTWSPDGGATLSFRWGGNSPVFSPDGQRVGLIYAGSSLRVLDVVTGKQLVSVKVGADTRRAVFSPDGGRIVTLGETSQIWDAATGAPITAPLRPSLLVLDGSFSPNGRWVLTAGTDRAVRLWDPNSGEPAAAPLTHSATVRTATFSPDGRRILTGGDDGTVRLWDLAGGELASLPVKHPNLVYKIAFHPDSRRVLTVGLDGTAVYWELATGRQIESVLTNLLSVSDASFSADGQRVAIGYGNGTVQVWNLISGAPVGLPFQHQGPIHHIEFSPGGLQMVTASGDGFARVWDLPSGKLVARMEHTGPLSYAAFTPDGKKVVTATVNSNEGILKGTSVSVLTPYRGAQNRRAQAQVWDATTGKALGPPIELEGAISRVSFSPDCRYLVTACSNPGPTGRLGQVFVWDVALGKRNTAPLSHPGTVLDACFSSDGKRVVTSGAEGSVRIWDVATGKRLTAPLSSAGARQAAFSPDNRLVITAGARGARLWDALTGEPVSSPFKPSGAAVVNLARFSPDGQYAVLATGDGYAQAWKIPRSSRSLDDELHYAEMLAAGNVDEQEAIHLLTRAQIKAIWEELRAKYPGDSTLVPEQVLAWRQKYAADNTRRAQEHIKAGQLAEARVLIGRVRQVDGLTEVAAVLDDLANLRDILDNATTVGNMRQVALDTLRVPIDDLAKGTASWPLSRLAEYLLSQGKLPEAEKLFEDVIALQRKTFGEASVSVALALHCYADFVFHREKKTGAVAESLYRDELAIWEKLNRVGSADYTTALRALVDLLKSANKPAEIEALYRELLPAQRAALGSEHPEVANTLHKLGETLRDSGKWTEAEEVFREAVGIRRKLFGYENLDLAHSIHGLAWVLNHNGQRAEAEALSREELATRKKLLSNAHPDVAATLYDLVVFPHDQGKLAEAETMAREAAQGSHTALAQYEKLASDRNRHNECRSFAISYEALGQIFKEIGRAQEAEKVYRDTQVLWRKLVADFNIEDDRWHLAVNYDALGQLLKESGPFDESAETYRQALAVGKKLVAEFNKEIYRDHLCRTMANLAELLEAADQQSEAELLLRDDLALWKRRFGNVHREVDHTLASLAHVLKQEGKLAEAEAVMREELAVERRLSGDEHPFVANSLAELASILLAEEKFTDAEPPARECLTVREKILPGDWQTFNARSLLGGSLLGQKKFPDAETFLLSGYEGMKQRENSIPAGGKRYLKETLQRLVQLYKATDQSEKAAEWNRKLAEFSQP